MNLIKEQPQTPAAAAVNFVRTARLPNLMIVAILLVTLIVNVAVQPKFFSTYALTSTLATLVPLTLIALAQTMVVLGGGIDLSIGASVTLASTVAVVLMDGDNSRTLLGILAAILVGAACGLANGLIISLLRLQPIIVTFATGSVFSGLALLVLPKPGGTVPSVLTSGYRAAIFGVPIAGLLVLITIGLWMVLRKTKLTRHIYAIGGDKEAAYASVVPVQKTQIASYVVCGAIGGLTAIALLANSGSGDPFIGLDMMLNSVAAVVIGGTALMGGRGSGLGSIMGAVVLALISNIVFFAGVSTNYRPLVSGIVIIAALSLSAFTMNDRRRTS